MWKSIKTLLKDIKMEDLDSEMYQFHLNSSSSVLLLSIHIKIPLEMFKIPMLDYSLTSQGEVNQILPRKEFYCNATLLMNS